jgi:radical SAM superfamily enzyme YgiQ (UPF0313 family)
MSNLGFQQVYQLFNSYDEVLCERAFWDPAQFEFPGNVPISLESGRRLASFSILAFSISFENDFVNVVRTLISSGIRPLAEERSENDPLVLVGGPCSFMNPEPLAPFVDLFALGDGECVIRDIVENWLEQLPRKGGINKDFIEVMAGETGFYAPGFLEVEYYPGGEVKELIYRGNMDGLVKRARSDTYGEDLEPLLSPFSHFESMPLLEVGSGCSRGCRFCAASYIYFPPDKRSMDDIRRDIDRLLPMGDGRVGLIGAALSDHPDLDSILEYIETIGGETGLSSMRLDGIDEGVVELLSRLGVKTLTCAPEAGSQRMRDIIRKSLTEENILGSIDSVARSDVSTLKMYFMVGLPFERDQDIESIIGLIGRTEEIIRRSPKETRISLKISSFVPKPFTPFQWTSMDREDELKRKMDYLNKEIRASGVFSLKSGSVREAVVQAIFSRGDRKLALCILDAAEKGSSIPVAMRRAGLDKDFYLYRERLEDEIFPWDFIDHGFQKKWLFKESKRAEEISSGWIDQNA